MSKRIATITSVIGVYVSDNQEWAVKINIDGKEIWVPYKLESFKGMPRIGQKVIFIDFENLYFAVNGESK